MICSYYNHSKGFTLVELSIVMIIIGLLIGGVLKGQQLIENSKINSTISQVKAFQAATNTFRDSYASLPGDIFSATALVPNCTASAFCQGGNGDLTIGTKMSGIGSGPAAESENTQYWKHLALADLIAEINGNANPATLEWGKTNPSNKLGGGFVIVFLRANYYSEGHWIKLRQNLVGNDSANIGENVINPRIARIIDSKIDDGIPGSGSMISHDVGAGSVSGCEYPNQYDESFSSNNCIVLFKLNTK